MIRACVGTSGTEPRAECVEANLSEDLEEGTCIGLRSTGGRRDQGRWATDRWHNVDRLDDAQRISPARVHRRLGAAPFRFVHDVVVHEGGDVNQLDDHRQIRNDRG